MPNLRIVTKNALRQAASLTASSTAGNLAVSSLAAAVKSSLHRFTGTNGSYRATWAAPARIGCVALPFCNWSPTAKQRVRVSKEKSVTNLLPNSEGSVASLSAKGGSISDAGTDGNFANWIRFSVSAGSSYAYRYVVQEVVVGATVTLSLVMTMDDGGAPVVGNNSANGDFTFVCHGDATNAANSVVQNLGGGVYRVSKTVIVGRLNRGYGLLKAPTQSARGFRVTGFMLELGDKMTSYYPSGSTPSVRPTGYIDSWQSYDYDSGWVLACPAPAVELEGFTPAQAASAYAYGGGAYARHWLPQQLDATGLAVDIADPDNLQGYIEAACLVAGPVWSPRYNASGTSVSVIDRTEISRSAAGDQLVDPGTMSRKVSVDLRKMSPADRAKFLDLLRNSRAYPVLLSVFPEHADLELERDHMLYGRRTKDSDIAYQFSSVYSTTFEIEEI